MNAINFFKYQGTGNDFIMIDDRAAEFDVHNLQLIEKLCHRRFGIGADGVILIREHPDFDFEMIYFNPDGSQSLCGNGSRCAVRFAQKLGMIKDRCKFLAVDGPHEGSIVNGTIHIRMPDVGGIQHKDQSYFVDTGSPHHVEFVPGIAQWEVVEKGRKIRNSYGPQGSNVNFVELAEKYVHVRTYERGVEDETLSCGTGVTAVAMVLAEKGHESPITINTSGGELQVAFEYHQGGFTDVFLIGPAQEVFAGTFEY